MLAEVLLLSAGCKREPPHATISGHIEGCKDQWKEWVETEELPGTEVPDLKPLDGSMALAYGTSICQITF